MSLAEAHGRLQIPESLQAQLGKFRGRVRSIKMAEAALAASLVAALVFLAMFAADRLVDAPRPARFGLLAAALLGLAIVPLAAYRWVWGSRTLEQLARILARTQPKVGDHLLGVIELSKSDSEQKRSLRLCQAAIEQVAEEAQRRDFTRAVPRPKARAWALAAAGPLAVVIGLFALAPSASSNTLARLVAPWKAIPRYTFAAVEPLPSRLVVPHGEPFTIEARLTPTTAWKPEAASSRLEGQSPVGAKLADGRYAFAFPAQISPGWVDVRVGDFRHRVLVEPTHRPELAAATARVAWPDYLGRAEGATKDVRSGSISLVKGARARFEATASRELATATVDGKPRVPSGASVLSPETTIEGPRTMAFAWRDVLGLAGKSPFPLAIAATVDEPPVLTVEDLPRQKVVLDSEQLPFKVRAQDDFGVRRVGIEWKGVDDPTVKTPAQGEKILAAGGNDKEVLDLRGTFAAKPLGIEPQAITLRVFAEDYLPGRARVYSATYTLYVLDPSEHAIWLTEQLSKWHRQSLEVRDREMGLYETNRQIRALSDEDLDRPETRRRVENQAAAERANGRRLNGLVNSGEDLVKQAARNPEFGVGHLEKWAEMLQVLKDISSNRMPSVADLLKQAAQAPIAVASTPKAPAGPMAGQVKGAGGAGKPAEVRPDTKPGGPVPTVVDRESQQQPPEKDEGGPGGKKNPSNTKLKLPTTTLAGKPGPAKPPVDAPEVVDKAIEEQRDLLAEFEKVADELNRVLANLEGSTLVKRLKAASRSQYKIADRIDDGLGDTFGVAQNRIKPERAKVLAEMGQEEAKGSVDVSNIMDDLDSYFERRKFAKFKSVLDDMRRLDVIGALRLLGDDLRKENGLSITQCEFWSDTLDRWAEDLVDPANSGSCPGGKSPGSLPPSIVLEVLQVLEAEINLREETRVTEQARAALAAGEHPKQATRLSVVQEALRERIIKVTERILQLKDAETVFAYELKLMGEVESAMHDTVAILARPETGKPAIAAETEVIELILKSKRINPGGGGGGGSTPGGGGGGITHDSALALLGKGANEKELREDRGTAQATGETGSTLPEEFRSGLDEYFNRLEGRPAQQR